MKIYTQIFALIILFFSINIHANVAKPFGIEIGKTKKQDLNNIFKNNLIELPGEERGLKTSIVRVPEFEKYGIVSIMLGSSYNGTIDYLAMFINKELIPELVEILESKYNKVFAEKGKFLLHQYTTGNSIMTISDKFPGFGTPLLVYLAPQLLEKSMNQMSDKSFEDIAVKNLKR